MIGSADWMLRLSRYFGKREKFAAVHPAEMLMSAGCWVDSPSSWPGTQELNPLSSLWPASLSLRLRDHRRQRVNRRRSAKRRRNPSIPCEDVDCFAYARNGMDTATQRPGRSSRLPNPAATLMPTWPCTLSGCSAIELAEPPTSTLPPTPTPSVALPCAPT